MSTTTHLCTTTLGTPPILPGGGKLYDRQAQIRTVVQRRLGERHASLLAEAQLRPGDDCIVWSSPIAGLVRAFATLPAAVRDSVRAECDALLADIDRVGQALEDSATGDGRLAGALLRRAATRASDDHLFLVGNQPVLAGWGCESADAGTVLPTAATTTAAMIATPPLPAPCWLTPAGDPACPA